MRMIRLALIGALFFSLVHEASAQGQQFVEINTGEAVFAPIVPCRAFDTKAGGNIPSNGTRNFQITGSTDFRPQGGPFSGCGIPSYATAVAISLTALLHTSDTYLTAFGFLTPQPQVASLSAPAGHKITAGSVVALGRDGAMSVFASKSARVIGEITGYYARPIFAKINAEGNVTAGSGRLFAYKANGGYTIVADRFLDKCHISVSAFESTVTATQVNINFNSFYVFFYGPSGLVAARFSAKVDC